MLVIAVEAQPIPRAASPSSQVAARQDHGMARTAPGRATIDGHLFRRRLMVRIVEIALSFGLIVLWVAGLCFGASTWLTWFVLVAGLIAFGGAARFTDSARAGEFGWGALAAGLLLLWIVALITRATPWLTWWTFAFACASALLAAASASGRIHFGRARSEGSA
ncbi:MAG TPA: hypothetical protein VN853_02910 [Polyangia bacterium]|nr:hypothetical protein [Polyangia bacterium]